MAMPAEGGRDIASRGNICCRSGCWTLIGSTGVYRFIGIIVRENMVTKLSDSIFSRIGANIALRFRPGRGSGSFVVIYGMLGREY